MNILLINHYAGSPEMGMEFRPYYFATEWIKMGHQVKIVAGDYSHLRIKNPKVNKDFQKDIIDGISYYWLRTGDYNGNGVRRALTMFRFVGKLWLNAGKIEKEWKPDVVISSSTYPLDTYAAQRIAKKSGAKLIHEVHDMWPSTLYEVGGMSKKNPFVVLMQFAENSAYKNSDKVVSLPPLAKAYMVKHGMSSDKFVHIPNGITEEEWENVEKIPVQHKQLLELLQKEQKFIVGYFGGHALSNALDVLIDAAKTMNDRETVFVLVGNGVEKEALLKRKEQDAIDNIFFLPPINKREVPNLLMYFDCIYMGSRISPLYRFGICMNKIYDSMMSGKPIICAITTSESPIDKAKCGIMVDSGDVQGVIHAIEQIKKLKPEQQKQMGEQGRNAVLMSYTYKELAFEFEKIF